MKFRALVTVGAIAAIAVPVADAAKPTGANGNTRDSVTGGGQMLDGNNPTGAGDTVAFTAHRERGAADGSDAATGQIQVNRRGTNAIKFHGTISCLNTSGVPGSGAGYAYMSGMSRANKNAPAQPFELYVSDGGKGAAEQNDFIALFVGTETTSNDDDDTSNGDGVCGFEEYDPSTAPELGRGNVQVRNRNESEDADPAAPSAATTAALLALF